MAANTESSSSNIVSISAATSGAARAISRAAATPLSWRAFRDSWGRGCHSSRSGLALLVVSGAGHLFRPGLVLVLVLVLEGAA
jgi:hypothetical protein